MESYMELPYTLETVRTLMGEDGRLNEASVNAIKIYNSVKNSKRLRNESMVAVRRFLEFMWILRNEGYIDRHTKILSCTYRLSKEINYTNGKLVLMNILESSTTESPCRIGCYLEITQREAKLLLKDINKNIDIIKPLPLSLYDKVINYDDKDATTWVKNLNGDLNYFNKETIDFVNSSLSKFQNALENLNDDFDNVISTFVKLFHADHVTD